MDDNRKLPESAESTPLTDDQLAKVTGGEMDPIILVHPMRFKCCAADPSHEYVEIHDACPICGCREFTYHK